MAKAKTQTQSASERYAQIRRAAASRLLDTPAGEDDPIFDVTTSSGMEWKCRKPKLQLFVEAGVVPATLAIKMLQITSEKATDAASIISKLSEKEMAQNIALNSAIVRYVCVHPRIVEVSETDDEIGFDEVTQGDYNDLLNWALTGGEEAARLGNFRTR